MNKKHISMLDLSDIHLGHRTNDTSSIIEHLDYYFMENNSIFKKLDIIFVSGDYFDRLLSTNSEEYSLCNKHLTSLALYCQKNNIKLRFLEGTPSHDWKQLKVFNNIIKELNIDIDFKYIDTLHIEYIKDLGINVLYVPDEYNEKAIDTLNEVKELMLQHSLYQVDIAVMHGQFRYQLPIFLESSHIEEEYLELVKYYIFIGHIHTHSVYERIIAPGSFDRLAHNEEEEKGAVLANIYINGDMDFRFIPNKKATIFKTLYINNEIDIENIKQELNKYKSKANIRLRVNSDTNLKDSLNALKDIYKNINIKIEYTENSNDEVIHILDIDKATEGFAITESNIINLIENRLNNLNLDNSMRDLILSEAKEIHKELR